MEKSQSIINIAQALMKFQANMGKIVKSAENPFFKSKYAELPDIQDAIRQPLAEAGLCYLQLPDGDKELTTMLIHAESGEYMQATCDIHLIKNDPQAWGSAMTYAKRYALVAILALNVDKDDDGNAASQAAKKAEPKNVNTDPKKEAITEEIFMQWSDAVNAQTTIEGLGKLYDKELKKIENMPTIKALFTKRKEALQKKQPVNA